MSPSHRRRRLPQVCAAEQAPAGPEDYARRGRVLPVGTPTPAAAAIHRAQWGEGIARAGIPLD